MATQSLPTQRELCDDLRVVRLLPDAGHWIQQERPQEVTTALRDFFDGIRTSAGEWEWN